MMKTGKIRSDLFFPDWESIPRPKGKRLCGWLPAPIRRRSSRRCRLVANGWFRVVGLDGQVRPSGLEGCGTSAGGAGDWAVSG